MERIRRTRSRRAEAVWAGRPVREVVRQRRAQMLLHSYLYYSLDQPIVSDHQWQAWANELVEIQAKHGTTFGYHDDQFADWDASTGYHLKADDAIQDNARRVLAYEEKMREEQAPIRIRRARR